MDSIAGVEEAVELGFSESIVSRDDALAVLAGSPGLGPPDLCWLQKGRGAWSPGADGVAAGSHGYYHHVLGGDVSSSGAIAGAFARLMSRVERPGLLAGLWSGAELSVQRGFYCCYDAISRTDLRCELCVPGGVVCGVVDAAGNLHDARDQQLWQQAQVSAFVRSQLYDPEMTLNGGCITLEAPVPSAAAERQLLAAVESLYSQGVLPMCLDPVSVSQGFGAVPEHADLALFSVWNHFRRRQRWAAAEAFFARLGACYPAAAVWQAAALRASGHAEGVLELLGSALERSPSSPPLLAAMAAECMRLQQVDTAARLARRAVHAQPRCRPAWLILARCYASEGQYAEALVTLNAVPTPPLPRDERELLLVVPPPEPERTTAPQARPYQPDLEAARALALEEGDPSGASRLLAYLPGAVLLNKEPPDAGPWPDPSPNRVTRAVLGAVYAQLQDIVGALGWDGFLSVRSSVFVMHESAQGTPAPVPAPSADIAAAAAAQGPGAEGVAVREEPGGRPADTPGGQEPPASTAMVAASRPGTATAQAQGQQQPGQEAQRQDRVQTPNIGSGARRSSNSSSKADDKPDPAAFYASRVQAALGGSASPGLQKQQLPPTPPQQQQPGRQQEQHLAQRRPAMPLASGSAMPEALGSSGPAVFEPMAGRVLLLGRTTRRLGSAHDEGSCRSSRRSSSGGGSVAPSSSFAARAGVEDLSRLASATTVAQLPHPQKQAAMPSSANPQLWHTVFGGDGGGSGKPAQGPLITSPGGLPRIRTRPLGEGCEESHPSAASASGQQGPCRRGWSRRPLGRVAEGLRCFMPGLSGASAGQPVAEGNEGAAAETGQWQGPQPQPQQQQQQQQQQQPPSQGILRAGSLLLRARTSSGTPGGLMAGSGRSGGPLFSVGSGPLSPGGQSRHSSVSGGGHQVRSLEADREAIANGRRLVQPLAGGRLLRWEQHTSDPASVREPSARLCVRWLDELVVGLWHDLSAYLEWRCLDQSLKESRGMTHAEWVLASLSGSRASAGGQATGGQERPGSRANGGDDGAGPKPPVLTAADWARRGFLAERLGHTNNARTAYRVAVTLAFSLSAYTALLRLEAQAGAVADALMSAQQLLLWHDARAAAVVGSGSSAPSGLVRAPTPVSWFVGELAAGQGVERVMRALEEDATAHGLLLRELQAWQQQQERDQRAAAAAAASG